MLQKTSPYTRGEILTVVITALVGAALCALFMLWYLNLDNRWIRVDTPPGETPVQIVAVDRLLRAYVRTEEGNVFLCGSSWNDACRAVAPEDVPAIETPPLWRTCESFPAGVPNPPGRVVDSLQAGRCLEAVTYSELVITEDGAIWQWRRVFSWANQFAAAVCVSLGIALGVATGVIVVRLRRWLRADAELTRERGAA